MLTLNEDSPSENPVTNQAKEESALASNDNLELSAKAGKDVFLLPTKASLTVVEMTLLKFVKLLKLSEIHPLGPFVKSRLVLLLLCLFLYFFKSIYTFIRLLLIT
jgi:hypothetical protein